MYHIFFVHSLVEGYLCCFQVQLLQIMLQTQLNKCPCNIIDHPLGICSRVVFLSLAVCCFTVFSRNHHIDFQSGCTSLDSYQQWKRVPLTPHSLQHKKLFMFLIIAILSGARLYLRVVLLCIYQMAKMLNIFLRVFQPFEVLLLRKSLLCGPEGLLPILINPFISRWFKEMQ